MHKSWNLMILLLEVDTCLNFFICTDVIGLTDFAKVLYLHTYECNQVNSSVFNLTNIILDLDSLFILVISMSS